MSDVTIFYPVNDCYDSIQGEGALTGIPMTILRLQVCDVGCPWCDTKETWKLDLGNRSKTLPEALGQNSQWVYLTAYEIARYIATNHQPEHQFDYWVLITGGEPAIRPLAPLVASLQLEGFRVACETSGTELGAIGAHFDWLCVSPKLGMPGGKTVRPNVMAMADEVKMPGGRERDLVKLSELLDAMPPKDRAVVSLQPISQNKEATRLCVTTAKRRGWRVSIQVHKTVNLP
jgi:7-carboxy-7-deazaguanine synthase